MLNIVEEVIEMICITGDVHGWEWRFDEERCPYLKKLGAGDFLIVAGDFGFVFLNDQRERKFLDSLAKLPYTVLFIDGNHENFDALFKYPLDMWNGGKVHIIRDNVLHLMRGQVYGIEGKKFFTFGGGYSIDKFLRREGVSWWKEEMPGLAEYEEGMRNLEKHGFKVDYIITHAAPESVMNMIFPNHDPEKELNLYLERVKQATEFRHWYFAHLHMEEDYPGNFTMLYTNGVFIE